MFGVGCSPVLYFDHNATHPLSRAAREAWLEATERYIGNPSSPHRLGARADAALEQARVKLAAWLGCDPHEIIWTSGATEANNAVLHHAARAGEGEAWISALEHPCVLEAGRRYFGEKLKLIPVTRDGVADGEWLAKALRSKVPSLIGLMAANNETGVLQPWREVAALCRDHGIPFFCDAAQWIGRLPATGFGQCNFVSGCAHKFGGPQGVGFLKAPRNFHPLILGGAQEEGRRAGTENVAGVSAMIAALEARQASMTPGRITELVELRNNFERRIAGAAPGTEIVGAAAERLWNTVSAVLPEMPDCRQRWVVKLDKLGFAVSTGSACASGKEQPSHVLAAMGVSGAARVLRFSSGWETTAADWDALADGVGRAFHELNAR